MNLLIIGAGGHGKCCYDIAVRMNCFTKIEFVDDSEEYVLGKKVIGKQSDLESLIDFCGNLPVSLRFIELMPLGSNKRENRIEEVQSYFASHYNIEEITERLGNGPAHYIRIKNMKCVIGFIEALHHKFCHECNRVRLSSTGSLKLCLFHKNSIALKPYIGNEIKLEEVMRDAIYMKPEQHHFEDEQSGTVMNQIGG